MPRMVGPACAQSRPCSPFKESSKGSRVARLEDHWTHSQEIWFTLILLISSTFRKPFSLFMNFPFFILWNMNGHIPLIYVDTDHEDSWSLKPCCPLLCQSSSPLMWPVLLCNLGSLLAHTGGLPPSPLCLSSTKLLPPQAFPQPGRPPTVSSLVLPLHPAESSLPCSSLLQCSYFRGSSHKFLAQVQFFFIFVQKYPELPCRSTQDNGNQTLQSFFSHHFPLLATKLIRL